MEDLTTGYFNTGATVNAIVTTRDTRVFIGTTAGAGASAYDVWSCSDGWKTNLPTIFRAYTIETSEGRIGAFGI
jgi:hypothetical protein